LDQTTQQNAALVEQASAAAESLRQQAGELLQVVAQFRTGDALPAPAAAPAAPPRPSLPRAATRKPVAAPKPLPTAVRREPTLPGPTVSTKPVAAASSSGKLPPAAAGAPSASSVRPHADQDEWTTF
ncbi:MAG: hypothetical protein N2688_15690, partial [Burkholderiaceae bacterium]|nr:hypothetical protein [Burkholderiaceae bacterium]